MQPLLAVKHKTPAFYKGTDLTAAEGHYDVLKTTDIKRAKHHVYRPVKLNIYSDIWLLVKLAILMNMPV